METKIEESKAAITRQPHIPLKDDGSNFEIIDLYTDQQYIAFKILSKIEEWLTCDDFSTFEPLRCVINGQGGTGKSVLLNTLVSTIRQCLGENNVVLVAAPTGTAAYNVNGTTLHNMIGQGTLDGEYASFSLSHRRKRELIERFKDLLILIIDERSLLSSRLLGTVEQILSETVFEGCGSRNFTWGGIPVIILSGDDYQLGGFGEGAHDALPGAAKFSHNKNVMRGRELFVECATTVFKLPKIRRVDDSRQNDIDLLDRLRIGENVIDDDVNRIQNLHLDVIERKHGKKVVEVIKSTAIHLFFTNAKRIQHNLVELGNTNGPSNPTATIKPHCQSTTRNKAVQGHFTNKTPKTSLLCVGCKTSIKGRNFYPLWGLHNGACGTVKEIVFSEGKSPNNNDLPNYVVADFPLYRGPVWDKNNPKSIPIPMCTIRCRYSCCSRIYCLLEVCFARTIHTFQGLQAGPPQEGKPQHLYHSVICDPDIKSVEQTHTGLLYTATSRGTTLGDNDGLNSAVYFAGHNLTRERIQDLTISMKGNEYVKVTKRRNFVDFLDQHTVPCGDPSSKEAISTFAFFQKHLHYDTLYDQRMKYSKYLQSDT